MNNDDEGGGGDGGGDGGDNEVYPSLLREQSMNGVTAYRHSSLPLPPLQHYPCSLPLPWTATHPRKGEKILQSAR